tara:strand:+ start:603 stop:899 length:297 start_codon:yes stop_codon:yes gene_type:complete
MDTDGQSVTARIVSRKALPSPCKMDRLGRPDEPTGGYGQRHRRIPNRSLTRVTAIEGRVDLLNQTIVVNRSSGSYHQIGSAIPLVVEGDDFFTIESCY